VYGVTITTADGRRLRYAGDEARADGIPEGLNYASTIPGGDDTATFSLRTKITDELPFSLLDDVRIYGPGNQTLWEGMVAQLPRQSGDDLLVNVQCVGHSARLKWDTGFSQIYIDRELTRWEGPSAQRQLTLVNAGFRHYPTRVERAANTGVPHLMFEFFAAGTVFHSSEAVYDAGANNLIGGVYYDLAHTNATLSDTNYFYQVGVAQNEDLTGTTYPSGNLRPASPATGSVSAAIPRRYAWVEWFYNSTSANGPQAPRLMGARELAVYGDHGLTEPGGSPTGFYPHEVLEHIVVNAASGLTVTGITEHNSFPIPQLAFIEPTTAEQAILEVNKYYLYEWGCWGKEFFWRPGDPDRLCWEARLDQGAHLSLEGDEADNAINGVIVAYTVADGTQKVAGPVGSGLGVEDVALGDTSASNPVNAHGIPRKYARLDVSYSTTDAGAIAIGAAYLAQLSLPARKGSINLTGLVQHPTKGLRPVSEVRAGDWIKVTDLTGTSDIPRRIIQASHSPDDATCQVDVGNDIDKVDAILQRVGIATTVVGG
jgi:hypothetical protein